MCLIFLDMLSPTAQEFCPDEFRGSSALVWGSQICDISTCDDPDVVAVAIPDVPRAQMQGFAQFPEITALPHSTHFTGKEKPSNNFKNSPILFLSILLTHLSRDKKKSGPEKEEKKRKDKNKIQ